MGEALIVIYKYELEVGCDNVFWTPQGRALHFGEQAGQLCVWVGSDPNGKRGLRRFMIVGSGMETPDGRYVGTVVTKDGRFVWHLFDCGLVPEAPPRTA